MLKEIKKRRGGRSLFSLIELLVVISIIVILTSLLLPALNKAKARSKNILCLSQVKQTYQPVINYHDDYGLVGSTYSYHPVGWYTWGEVFALEGYIKPKEKYIRCPFWNPSNQYETNRYSYGQMKTSKTFQLTWGIPDQYIWALKLNSLKNPSKTILLGDSVASGDGAYGGTQAHAMTCGWNNIHMRHERSANLACADGHAKNFKEAEIISTIRDEYRISDPSASIVIYLTYATGSDLTAYALPDSPLFPLVYQGLP